MCLAEEMPPEGEIERIHTIEILKDGVKIVLLMRFTKVPEDELSELKTKLKPEK